MDTMLKKKNVTKGATVRNERFLFMKQNSQILEIFKT